MSAADGKPRPVCSHYVPGIGRECDIGDRRATAGIGGCLDCEDYRDGSPYLGVSLYDMRRIHDWDELHYPRARLPRATVKGRLVWR